MVSGLYARIQCRRLHLPHAVHRQSFRVAAVAIVMVNIVMMTKGLVGRQRDADAAATNSVFVTTSTTTIGMTTVITLSLPSRLQPPAFNLSMTGLPTRTTYYCCYSATTTTTKKMSTTAVVNIDTKLQLEIHPTIKALCQGLRYERVLGTYHMLHAIVECLRHRWPGACDRCVLRLAAIGCNVSLSEVTLA